MRKYKYELTIIITVAVLFVLSAVFQNQNDFNIERGGVRHKFYSPQETVMFVFKNQASYNLTLWNENVGEVTVSVPKEFWEEVNEGDFVNIEELKVLKRK